MSETQTEESNVEVLQQQTASEDGEIGLSDKQLTDFHGNYARRKSDMDEVRGEMGALIKDFEEQGGHKAAFKLACKLKAMEDSKAQDFLRSLKRYCQVFGVFDQSDMFETQQIAAE